MLTHVGHRGRSESRFNLGFLAPAGPLRGRVSLPYRVVLRCLSYTSVSFRARLPITSSGTAKTYSLVATLAGRL
jgi:hypothetical protein